MQETCLYSRTTGLEGPEPLGPAPAALPVRKSRDFASVNISSSVSIFRGRASMEMKFCIDMAERGA